MEVTTSTQSKGSNSNMKDSLRIKNLGDISLIEWDMQGEKVNKLSSPMMTRLEEVITELRQSKAKAVVMISRKPKIFIAGADIEEIKGLTKKEEAIQIVSMGQRIINLIEDLSIPVIVAIHGACMGGGCELALAADYRIATDDPSTRIGLPETKLGIIPGFGGCVRLPRVIGLQAALDIILAGKAVDGKKAFKLGLVDQVVPAALLEEQAMKMAKDVIASGGKKRRKKFEPKGAMNIILESTLGRAVVLSKAKKMTLAMTRGNYPAQMKAIEVISRTYGVSNRGKALEIEAKGFGEVVVTDVSKNLIRLFYLTEGIKKQTGVADPSVKPREIKYAAVLGAGTMGGGIAQLFADKGIDVRLKDINNEAIAKGFQAARSIWEKELKKKRFTQYEFNKKMDLISGSTTYDGFGNLDLVVEAIVEDMGIKKKVIAETATKLKPNAIIATNTSSLSVTEMGEAMPNKANFVGMHFFNPVHKMPLVEVIRGEHTSDEVTATIFDVSKKAGKFPVVVKDGPGFLVNRLLLPYLNEAVYLLGEGVSIETIDKYYLDFGMPMGPMHLIDEIGIDVAVKVAKIFHKAFGERAEPSPLMLKLVDTKRLGKKNGKGFYLYDERGKKLNVDQSVYKEMGLPQPTNTKMTREEIVNRGIFAMINEAARALLEDKIVNSPDEVDLAMIMGTGFPPFRGGLLRHADSIGTDVICDELEVFATRIGPRFKPAPPLMQLAKSKKRFYSYT